MTATTFRDYVRGRRKTDTPAGDFVADLKSDSKFPDAKSWNDVENYLRSHGACEAAVNAGKSVWRGYRAAVRRLAAT